MNWTPKYINKTIEDRPRQRITADYWNSLMNLLVTQGDNNTTGIDLIKTEFTKNFEEIKAKLSKITEDASANTIESISVNGTPVEIDENKNVELDIPTQVAELSDCIEYAKDGQGKGLDFLGPFTGTSKNPMRLGRNRSSVSVVTHSNKLWAYTATWGNKANTASYISATDFPASKMTKIGLLKVGAQLELKDTEEGSVLRLKGSDLTESSEVVLPKGIDALENVMTGTSYGDPPQLSIKVACDNPRIDGLRIPTLQDDGYIREYLVRPATANTRGAVMVDIAMDDSSTNPVQNCVIKKYIDDAIKELKGE